MRFAITIAMICLALTGCGHIPYEQPADRANLERDLRLNPSDIVTIVEMAWCEHLYGDSVPCRRSDALVVLTQTDLLVTEYAGKKYRPLMRIKPTEVMCAHLSEGIEKAPNFLLFTREKAYEFWLQWPDVKTDFAKKKLILDQMVASDRKSFTGIEGGFIKGTDRVAYGAGTVPGTTIPIISRTPILEFFNPCL
ncbi:MULTISPECIES: hypothetical protein [unclassified Pseudomonas]|uniref:hypothetical protein n=1 Tax=unclassified Pseudomonas TaxID=196821 RepID=UPI000CD289BA|nr:MULTISPECIES: hypothetical protein [unclassified Pseudomonas]POA30953.1 hypothetical protein C1887_14630 [Pseudomonas sp. GW456-R21]POA67981.1 hypothetical protein C1884_11335 [Pseudomonas sp. GW460-R15]